MKLLLMIMSLLMTSSLFASEKYNLEINIKDGDKKETYKLISEVAATSFAESIKSARDEGNNPTKKMVLRDVKDVKEIKKADIVWNIDVQYGKAEVISNTTQIPGNDEATEIDLGKGSVDALRIYLSAVLKEKHEIRLLFAPLQYENQFVSDSEIFFNGVKFLAGEETTTDYQFNSYRLSYIYHFDRQGKMQYRLGFTGKIRDAYTLVRQNGIESTYDNVGFVPLLHLGVNILLTEKLNLDLEVEGSWAPVGYAADFRATLNYVVSNNVELGLGVGYLDGGADNDKVNTFAKVLFGFARVKVKF